jgi:hypothetical protein
VHIVRGRQRAFLFYAIKPRESLGMDLRLAISLMSGIFHFGIVIVAFRPETKDAPLPG